MRAGFEQNETVAPRCFGMEPQIRGWHTLSYAKFYCATRYSGENGRVENQVQSRSDSSGVVFRADGVVLRGLWRWFRV